MFKIVTLLTLLCHLRIVRSNFRTCVPNTQFILNDRICHCDGRGQWNDASCINVSHKQLCQPGQVVWQGCRQCACQDNGQLLCNNLNCPDVKLSTTKSINSIGHWCTPFRIYYVDCSICVCPESGRTANVQCVKDSSCTALRTPSITDVLGSNQNTCKPKVLYVFSCLQCLCSDEGIFVLSNCVETCPSTPKAALTRTCTPHSFYRIDCNVCLCPSNGVHTDASCTQQVCDGKYTFKVLQGLTSEVRKCTPHQFTSPQCLYCHCNPEGTINQETCLELNCLNTHFNEYNVRRSTCTPGEMVPFCSECFCLRNGTTYHEYCTKGCPYRNKIQILERVFKDSKHHQALLDWNGFDKTSDALTCKHNSIYMENGKYCLCPDSETKEKSCIVAVKKGFNFEDPAKHIAFKETKIDIDFKKSCTPSTFVDFDCNTCFCSKNGTIDPNWCTYDDCEEKRMILDAQKAHNKQVIKKETDTCVPGSITQHGCNFCICPDNGISRDKACTKNRCTNGESVGTRENFDCVPLEYYEVDCNICACPRDGIKNVKKCTKNICEDNFLRADACVPGRLFSQECNICICPPDGTKQDSVCTKHDCKKAETTWKKIFKFSNSIIEELPVDGGSSSKKLDLCFPGEEFMIGGHFCVCPEMGLRTFATCSDMVITERDKTKIDKNEEPVQEVETKTDLGIADSFGGGNSPQEKQLPQQQQLQQVYQQPVQQPQVLSTECYIYNNTATGSEGARCASGSLYIKGCQQCLCPFVDDMIEYCRSLNTTQCNSTGISSYIRSSGDRFDTKTIEKIALAPHEHTHYKCTIRGRVRDECHMCECEQDSVIREHCFTSTAVACAGVQPTFLRDKL